MKVLEINSVCGIRSTGRICTDLADILKENGHECKIAYGRETVPEKYKDISYRIGSDTDVKLHALKARFFDAAGFGSKRATERLVEKIRAYDPDIIHLHNIHGYYINIETLFRYLAAADKPVVWTLHDCWAFTGHCAHFTMAGCERWRTGCHDCPQKTSYPASVFLDCSARNFRKKKELFTSVRNMTLVMPSEWLAGLAQASFLAKYSVRTIHNGIDTDIFKPTSGSFKEKYAVQDKTIVLGVASAWGKSKGFDDFIKIAELLGDRYVVVLVGVQESQKIKLPKHMIGITRTNNAAELAEIYTAADVFVNLTYEDNYPTVNLEAQACGTPVITYRTGGSPESVDAAGVIQRGDIQSVAELVSKVDTLKVLTPPEKKVQYEKYIELYGELMTK